MPKRKRRAATGHFLGARLRRLTFRVCSNETRTKVEAAMPFTDGEQDIAWQKPDWTKNTKLRSTGKSAAGNLAKPITNLPHQKDQGPGFSKPEWTDEVAGKDSIGQKDLAKPITDLPHGAGDSNLSFAKPAWTKDDGLQNTGKGDKLKSGGDISRPIGGIRPVED